MPFTVHLHASPADGWVLWATEDLAGGGRPLTDLAPLVAAAAELTVHAELGELTAGSSRARNRLRLARVSRAIPVKPVADGLMERILARVRETVLEATGLDPDGLDAADVLEQRADRRSAVPVTEQMRFAPDVLALAALPVRAARLVAERTVVPRIVERFGDAFAEWAPAPGVGEELLARLRQRLPRLDVPAGSPDGARTALDLAVDRAARRSLADHLRRAGTAVPSRLQPLLDPDVTVPGDARATQRLARALDAFAESGRPELTEGPIAGSALIVRLHEPGDGQTWPLQGCLREESGVVRSLAQLLADADLDPADAAHLMAAVLRAAPALRDADVDATGYGWELSTASASSFLAETVPQLEAAGIPVMMPRQWTKQRPTVRLTVGDAETPERAPAQSAVGLNAMVEFDWRIALGDVELSAQEMERILAEQAELVQLRGDWVRIDQHTLRAAAEFLDRFRSGGSHRSGARAPRPPARGNPGGSVEPGASATPGSVELGAVVAALTGRGRPPFEIDELKATGRFAALFGGVGARRIPLVPEPTGLDATLRPYQRRGVSWLAHLDYLGLGGILADDMGLGKTVQVLALLCHERDSAVGAAIGPTLLVCPMSVVGTWQREAARFAPGLAVQVHHGPDRLRGEEFVAGVRDADLVLTTYSLLARDLADLNRLTWRRAVLDEAQHIKNTSTAVSQSARALRADRRLALTGTPVENRLRDLRALMGFVNPGLLPAPSVFQESLAGPIEQEHDAAALSVLKAVTDPFVLRRLKTDPMIISDLPEKIEMTLSAPLTPEQAGLYDALVKDMLDALRTAEEKQKLGLVVSTLTRLKQVCNHPAHYLGDGSPVLRDGRHRSGKLALVDDIIATALDEGGKVLLFTQFTQFGELLRPYWEQRFRTSVPFLHGGLTKAERDELVRSFQSADGPDLMLLSLRAGGTGLTLTAANHVVHLDRWWNPAVENQATDRAYRIGQNRAVQVRKLVSAGTVEERIDRVLRDKAQLAELTLSVGEGWIADLAGDELAQLFALDRSQVSSEEDE